MDRSIILWSKTKRLKDIERPMILMVMTDNPGLNKDQLIQTIHEVEF